MISTTEQRRRRWIFAARLIKFAEREIEDDDAASERVGSKRSSQKFRNLWLRAFGAYTPAAMGYY